MTALGNIFKRENGKAIAAALAAALLYGISSPVSKILLTGLHPVFLAALLYLGAGLGMSIVNYLKSRKEVSGNPGKFSSRDLKYIIAMIILDIAAPILLLLGLEMTSAGNASLLNNFEIVATSMIAMVFFRESIGRRLWIAIALITIASFILSVRDFGSLSFSLGSLLILAATVSWGLENNCTRMLSHRNPGHVVVIKGLGSGIGSLAIAVAIGELSTDLLYIVPAILLGFVAYGLSIYFYISAQRTLGAARTSTFYASAPFIGAFASWVVLNEVLTFSYLVAAAIMLAGTYLAATENHGHLHSHDAMIHEHMHSHDDGHHEHKHGPDPVDNPHSHAHQHTKVLHDHSHMPDIHHRHKHGKSGHGSKGS